MLDAELFNYLDDALEEEHGLVLTCSDPEAIKRKLFSLRLLARADGNHAYDCLTFKTNPGAREELIIINDGSATDEEGDSSTL